MHFPCASLELCVQCLLSNLAISLLLYLTRSLDRSVCQVTKWKCTEASLRAFSPPELTMKCEYKTKDHQHFSSLHTTNRWGMMDSQSLQHCEGLTPRHSLFTLWLQIWSTSFLFWMCKSFFPQQSEHQMVHKKQYFSSTCALMTHTCRNDKPKSLLKS